MGRNPTVACRGGMVNWAACMKTMADIGYRGPITLESMNHVDVDIAGGLAVWRPVAENPNDVIEVGLPFLHATAREAGLMLGYLPDDHFPDEWRFVGMAFRSRCDALTVARHRHKRLCSGCARAHGWPPPTAYLHISAWNKTRDRIPAKQAPPPNMT